MTRPERRPSWELYNKQTLRGMGMSTYPSLETAESSLEFVIRRDARGGRPDLHDKVPHMGVRRVVWVGEGVMQRRAGWDADWPENLEPYQ